MCGIAVTIDLPRGGEAKLKNHLNAFELTKEMVDRLHPRGPDDASTTRVGLPENDGNDTIGPEVVLGHTRLAIVGGSEAKSPFIWPKEGGGKMTLIHNGEIYNHKELRRQLVEEGFCTQSDFTTDCDSEVLLACCAERGVEWTLRQVRGMFAFVLVELTQGECFDGEIISRVIVARDTFGIKPLCCAFDDSKSRLVFASQVSAIPPLAFDEGSVQVKDILPGSYVEYIFIHSEDPSSWTHAYQVHRYISNDFDSNSIQPGHRIEGISDSYSFEDRDALNNLREKLIDAVSCRIPPPGSVETAVLLSGGLDSSLITSIAAALVGGEKLRTFNISFADAVGTDQAYARLVKEHLPNVQNEEVTFTFQEGLEVLPNVIECLETYDAVSVRAGVPLYLLSKHIKSLGFKVILCGEGADEVFAGYRLFEAFSPSNNEDEEAFSSELCRRLKHIDTSELQRVDRCTSAHGLEARVPFLDLAFVATAMRFPNKEVRIVSEIFCGCVWRK
jgi:asparagine synthase (glutamine-hydrolysing)